MSAPVRPRVHVLFSRQTSGSHGYVRKTCLTPPSSRREVLASSTLVTFGAVQLTSHPQSSFSSHQFSFATTLIPPKHLTLILGCGHGSQKCVSPVSPSLPIHLQRKRERAKEKSKRETERLGGLWSPAHSCATKAKRLHSQSPPCFLQRIAMITRAGAFDTCVALWVVLPANQGKPRRTCSDSQRMRAIISRYLLCPHRTFGFPNELRRSMSANKVITLFRATSVRSK